MKPRRREDVAGLRSRLEAKEWDRAREALARRPGAAGRPWPPEDTVLTFGKHRGRTIGEVGSDEDGLIYLDWALYDAKYLPRHILVAIVRYLDHPAVAPLVNEALERRGPLGDRPRQDP